MGDRPGLFVVVEINQAAGQYDSVLHGDIHYSLEEAQEAVDYAQRDAEASGRMDLFEVFELKRMEATGG